MSFQNVPINVWKKFLSRKAQAKLSATSKKLQNKLKKDKQMLNKIKTENNQTVWLINQPKPLSGIPKNYWNITYWPYEPNLPSSINKYGKILQKLFILSDYLNMHTNYNSTIWKNSFKNYKLIVNSLNNKEFVNGVPTSIFKEPYSMGSNWDKQFWRKRNQLRSKRISHLQSKFLEEHNYIKSGNVVVVMPKFKSFWLNIVRRQKNNPTIPNSSILQNYKNNVTKSSLPINKGAYKVSNNKSMIDLLNLNLLNLIKRLPKNNSNSNTNYSNSNTNYSNSNTNYSN